jgi:hypothetical protein
MAYVCNPSYSGAEITRIMVGSKYQGPHLNNPSVVVVATVEAIGGKITV